MSDSPGSMRLAKDIAADYLTSLDDRFNGKRHHLDSGFTDLDRKIPGWLHEGRLIVIAARPAMGKSALAQQLVEQVAEGGRTVVLFTLEMSAHEIAERSISRRSGVPIPALVEADTLGEIEWAGITKGFGEFAQLPLLVDDGTFDLAAIIHKAKAAAAALERRGLPPLGVIAVDYIQLVAAKAANRTLEVGLVTSALKRLAKELSVPVIALSQLSRAVENRTDKRPTMADLRESGQIEQDADAILFIYRDEYYNPDSTDKGVAEIIAAKNRHGATGAARLSFSAERVRFGDLAHAGY